MDPTAEDNVVMAGEVSSDGSCGFAPGGGWSGEVFYYLYQFRWELLIAIPAALPVKNWLSGWLVRQEKKWSIWVLELGPKAMAVSLLICSVTRLLSSTFRSFLYFQF